MIDPDGTYDPRLVNDRLLLGLKGTMSEYELSLLRQRGIAARDFEALRGELQFILPPGYCWNEIGQIEMDPDERVRGVIRLLFDKFQELEIRQALCRELEEARYDASLAARRYEVVDPTKRLVARELETRWNTALERVAHMEDRIARHDVAAALRPKVDRAALIALARDLPATWNAPGTDARTKQRITHILIREVVLDRDDATNEALVTIHWNGGRHTELRVSRVRTGRYPADRHPSPVEAVRKLGGQLPDRELAVTMNRMRCKPADGNAWTTVRVRELRERLGIGAFDPTLPRAETISADAAATRLGICVGSVHKLIREGVLPATQLMQSAPWQIPVAALDTEVVKTGVREITGRRPKFYQRFQEDKTLWLPSL